MRLVIMHKHDAKTEAGEMPQRELIEQMGQFIGEHVRKGQFLGGEGLRASATRTRLTFRGGECTVKHGPYAGDNELIHAVLLLSVDTREQAIGWAERYGRILGDGEIELGPVTEAWDLGLAPKPAAPPLRVLLLDKADAASESTAGRTAKQKADLSRLKNEMRKAGALASTETLAPSSQGKRLHFTDNRLRVLDGPFSESKELIGGFSLMQLDSLETAIEMCRRYAEILGGTVEIDVRPLVESDES